MCGSQFFLQSIGLLTLVYVLVVMAGSFVRAISLLRKDKKALKYFVLFLWSTIIFVLCLPVSLCSVPGYLFVLNMLLCMATLVIFWQQDKKDKSKIY